VQINRFLFYFIFYIRLGGGAISGSFNAQFIFKKERDAKVMTHTHTYNPDHICVYRSVCSD